MVWARARKERMERQIKIVFYCLFSFCVHLVIFFEVFKSMNEFGLILSFEPLKHYVIIKYQTMLNRVIL